MARPLTSVEDFRQAAERKLPKVIFDFIDGGAEDEFTVAENRRAFQDLALRPAVLAGTGAKPKTNVEVAGQRISLPVILGPTGAARMAGRAGEIGAAKASLAAGTTAVISQGTTIPLKRIVETVDEPPWLQVMFNRDRDWMATLLARTERLGVRVLVATVDTPVVGNRARDGRHGLKLPIRPRLAWAPSIARRPRWLLETLTSPPVTREGLAELGENEPLRAAMDKAFDPSQSWEYLAWMRERWDGVLMVKGVMRAEDAERAVELGCQGVIVSNHGGRQLDSLPSSLDVLAEVVAAVGAKADVLLDGGVRRGTDVIKAVALGAKACLVGRPWLWGLRVDGTAGVGRIIELYRDELQRSLTLLGVASVSELGPHVLLRRPGSGWDRVGAAAD